jgi:hypothetical protein
VNENTVEPAFNIPDFPSFNVHFSNLNVKLPPFKIFLASVFRFTIPQSIVAECLKAGIVDSIRKGHFLGNGHRRFNCNEIGKHVYSATNRRCGSTDVFSWTDKLSPSMCSLFSRQRILLRRWLTEVTDS